MKHRFVIHIICIVMAAFLLLTGCAGKGVSQAESSISMTETSSLSDNTEISETTTEAESISETESDIEPDWNTTDPDLLKWQFENAGSFPFSNMLTYLPAYTEDNASELLTIIIDNINYTNYRDFFSYEAPWYRQEDISWYLKEIFNISDAAWGAAFENWMISNQNVSRFEDGCFKGILAGMPAIGVKAAVRSAQYDGVRWTITFDMVSDYYSDPAGKDAYYREPSDIAVLEQKEINGQLTWTMCSLERPPLIIYKNSVIRSLSYSWNTLEKEYTIISEFADIYLPEKLYFDYCLNYSDEGELKNMVVNLGNHSHYEDHFWMISDNDVRSLDDAAEKCINRRTEYYSGIQDLSLTKLEKVLIGNMVFQHLEEKNPWHEDVYSDFYVSCFELSSGTSIYYEWEIMRSPGYGDSLQVDDPRVAEIIEKSVIH